jgi:hypothetical protein
MARCESNKTVWCRVSRRKAWRFDNGERHAHRSRLWFTHALTSFVGRERELDELRRLLATNRLVTLTGAGGSGRTRLAGELANSLWAELDGIFWVTLASITDPELVAAEIAQSVGIQGPGDRPHLDAVAAILRERRSLLVLDNFEHLLGAAGGCRGPRPGPRRRAACLGPGQLRRKHRRHRVAEHEATFP